MMPLEGSGMQQVCWAHRGGSSSCFRAMISMASQASDVVKGIQAGEEVWVWAQREETAWSGQWVDKPWWEMGQDQERQVRWIREELAKWRSLLCPGMSHVQWQKQNSDSLLLIPQTAPSTCITLPCFFPHLSPLFCCPYWENFCRPCFLLVFFN